MPQQETVFPCRVPQLHKTRVFKAVINEVLLAALEVRALSTTDVQRLESARGMMLRRLFGKRGFGAVFGEEGHRAVPRTVLKELTGLVEIGVELRTRRLLWLRSLAAENGGELRLDLAALFGKMHRQAESPVDPRGRLNNCAPAFLRLLASDLQVVVPGWAGFVEGWKESLLTLPPTQVRWRSEQSNALPRAPERNDSPLPHQRLQAKPSPAVGTPLQVAASVCVLPDGNCPDSLDAVTDEAWLEGI